MDSTVNFVMELIDASTSPLGDFRMPVCIQRIIRLNLGSQFFYNQTATYILLSRYKDHVMFWGVNPITVTNELRELAKAIGMQERDILIYYDNVQPNYWKQMRHSPFCQNLQSSQHTGVIHYDIARKLTDCDCTCHK
ncbi:MAG: hypothetical protein ACLPY5_03350 [Candidatus Bathyarchaeia archaeon]